MNALDNSLAQYLTPWNGVNDENDIPPPKMPNYHPNDDNLDLEMSDQNEERYEEQGPPATITTQTGKEYPQPTKQAKRTREGSAKTRPRKTRPKEKVCGS